MGPSTYPLATTMSEQSLEELRASSRACIDEIETLGVQVSPAFPLKLRLDLLVDALLPPGTENRAGYERAYEAAFASALKEMISTVRQQKLTASG